MKRDNSIHKTILTALLTVIDKLPSEKRVIVAVEGGSASGKTTLSKMLEESYPCTVFHTDDFFLRPEQRTAERYKEIGGNFDRERFMSEVAEPLTDGRDIFYRRFDCSTMTLSDEIHIRPERLVIVEGVYSMHPELAELYDFSVFLDISSDLQRERIVLRNPPELAERFFERWIPLEETYFEKANIRGRCRMIIPVSGDK